jgi:hypothetical protein
MSDQITSIVTEAIHRVCNHYSCGEIQDELVQAVLVAVQEVVVSPVPQLQDLHQQIMNIPCRVPLTYANHAIRTRAYEIGHRDARHAAAELVAGAAARPETDQK